MTPYIGDSFSPQVGVFVSIVSTKIPFKGAGKEYIGDDIEEMVGAVKGAIQASADDGGVGAGLFGYKQGRCSSGSLCVVLWTQRPAVCA